MKRTIRNGCFETNSSSMHSIVVSTLKGDSNPGSFYVSPRNNMISTYSSDVTFERSPFQILSSVIDKAYYAIASYNNDEEMIDTINGIVAERLGHAIEIPYTEEYEYRNPETGKEYEWYYAEWIKDPEDPTETYPVLKKKYLEDGEKRIPLEWREEKYVDAYVDHQSQGLLQGFLKDNNVTIKDFITKARYIVIIDGDETCAWEQAKESGIVDLAKIESEYPAANTCYDSYLWRLEHEDDD